MAQQGNHSHEPDNGKQDSKRFIEELKGFSINETPTVALATALIPTTDCLATQLALPLKTSLLETSQTICKKHVVKHPTQSSATLENIKGCQHFVVFDSDKEDRERILYLRILNSGNSLRQQNSGLLLELSKIVTKLSISCTPFTFN